VLKIAVYGISRWLAETTMAAIAVLWWMLSHLVFWENTWNLKARKAISSAKIQMIAHITYGKREVGRR